MDQLVPVVQAAVGNAPMLVVDAILHVQLVVMVIVKVE